MTESRTPDLLQSTPHVSVVMGVHNDAPYLRKTIESVLTQQGVDIEFVIVNDGSTDGSTRILREFAQSNPRIRLVEQKNRGLTEALIRGCEIARGEYICRQDAGDISRAGRMRALEDALNANDSLAFVSTWTEVRGPEMEYLYTIEDDEGARTPIRILGYDRGRIDLVGGPTHHGAVMMRKEFYDRVGGYRREFYLAQDKDLWFRLAEVGMYQVVPRALYITRVLPTSRTSSYRELQSRLRELARQGAELRRHGRSECPILTQAARLKPEPEAVPSTTLAKAYYFIAEALRRNRDPRCRGYFREALRLDPFRWKTYLRVAQVLAWPARFQAPHEGEMDA